MTGCTHGWKVALAAAAWLAASAAANAQAQQGPLVLEPITGGILAAPEVKVTSIDRETRGLLGGYVGYVFSNGLFAGGAVYAEVDWDRRYYDDGWRYFTSPHEPRRHMRYGGGLVGWTLPAASPLRPGLRALVGGGWARRNDVYFIQRAGRDWDDDWYDGEWQHFFAFEPQADVAIRLSRRIALDIAGGYRFIWESDGLDRALRGPVGSISLQVGRF